MELTLKRVCLSMWRLLTTFTISVEIVSKNYMQSSACETAHSLSTKEKLLCVFIGTVHVDGNIFSALCTCVHSHMGSNK